MKRTFSPAPSQLAFDWVDRCSISPQVQLLPLALAAGRILAQDIPCTKDIPPQAQCARDGFALRAADTLGAGDYNPLPLSLLNTADSVVPGSAIQVTSGDPLPSAADAVLPLDQAEVRKNRLDVSCSLAAGDGVIQQGEECRQQDILLPGARCLRPQDLALLATAGISQLSVTGQPRVQLLMAGYYKQDANGPLLSALIQRDGGHLVSSSQTSSAQQLEEALSPSDADLILISGGSGYAANDYAVQVLQQMGVVELDGVSIHPGGSVVLGKIAQRPVIVLPGSSLGCLSAYDLLVARLLRRMACKPGQLPYRSQLYTLSRKLVSRIGLFELARMRVDGNYTQPLAVADERLLSSSIHAHGFVLLPESSEGYAQGSQVEVYLYDEGHL